jgi:hypothetical protein
MEMNITSIKYLRRKNLGNYEHEEITVDSILSEGESPEVAFVKLKQFVEEALSGTLGASKSVSETSLKTVQLSKEGEPKATAQMAPDSKYPDAKEETPKQEEPRKPRGGNKPANKSDDSGVESKGAKADSPVKEEKLPKGTVVFQNTDQAMRIRLSNYLNANYPKWKTIGSEHGADLEKKKAVIQKVIAPLNGQPFEDAQANMLPAFSAKVEELFKAYK